MQQEAPRWQVLLIGGSSGVGKSVISRELATALRISHVLVDDIRIAIQAVTSPTQLPALHYFLTSTNLATMPAEAFIAGLVGVGRALTPALCEVIGHHLAVPAAGRLILEGDGILPEIVAHLPRANGPPAVQTVFVHEADEAQLLRNFIQRDRGFNAGSTSDQRAYVHTTWRFGAWLKAEAEQRGLLVLAARPYATLAQRLLAAIA